MVLIDKLYNLGLSVSYDKVVAISKEALSQGFLSRVVVCPLKLRKSFFTTAAVGNIDGTGISIFQHSNGIYTVQSSQPTTNVSLHFQIRVPTCQKGSRPTRKVLSPFERNFAGIMGSLSCKCLRRLASTFRSL